MGPPVLQFAVAYAAGIAIGTATGMGAGTLVLAILAVTASSMSGWPVRLAAMVCVGMAGAGVSTIRHHRTCERQWSPGPHTAILRLHDAPGTDGRARASVVVAPEGCRGTIALRLDTVITQGGVTMVAVGTVRRPGILRVRHVRILDRSLSLRHRVRDVVRARIGRLYGPRAPLVEAMILGRRADVDPTLRETFVAAGLAHLLAISGLHVGIIALWVGLALRRVTTGPRALVVGAALTWLYVALLGFPVAATRAALFVSIAAAARARERRPPVGAFVGVAILVVLTADPRAVVSVGAWLSMTAVVGTVWGGRWVSGRRVWHRVVRVTAVSAGATLSTAPITALVFGNVAPVGVVTNLPAIPLAGLAVPGIFLSLALGGTAAGGAGLALAGIETVARIGASLPGGHVTGTPGFGFAAPWFLALGVVVWIAHRRPRSVIIRRRLWTLAVMAGSSFVITPLLPFTRSTGDRLEIHVLDVGQGDAIAIRTPRGRWMLVDGGPAFGAWDAGRGIVLPFLRGRGVRRLDAVMVSHGDADHLGGIPAVIDALEPPLVLEPGQPLGTDLYRRFLGSVDASGARWQPARRGDVLSIDSVRVSVLHPFARWTASHLDVNDNSLVLEIAYGDFEAILTGDVGWPVESLLVSRVEPVEVLKVGHHGSVTSSSGPWLDAVQPRVAVVSVGRDNRYGHPAPIVLDRLRERSVLIRRTDRSGTVTIRTDGRYFEVVRPHRPLRTRLRCLFQTLSPSSASSSSRSDCSRRPPGSSRISFTTSR